MPIQPLGSEKLYRGSALNGLDEECKSTKNLTPLDEIVGQERAQKAVEFAMSIKEKGYNIYAIGRNGLGKRTMVLRYLNRHEPNGNAVPLYDWCYVANFDDTRIPKVLKLPAGTGAEFKKAIEKLMTRLVKAMPLAFDNEMYYSRAETLKSQLAKKQESALLTLTNKAKTQSISLSLTPQGEYQLVALNGEEPHTEESFATLTEAEQQQFEEAIDSLEIELRGIVRKLTEWEETYSDKLQKLDEEIALEVIAHVIKALKDKYKHLPEVKQYLSAMQADMLDNLDIFLGESEEQVALAYAALEKKMPRRYQVNVLVNQDDHKFPVVVEESPSYHSIFGYVENATYKGTVFTDFSLIRPGSLHRANGGVLMMDAVKVLERPYVWDGLKRALRAKTLNLSSLEREVTLSGAISLDPEPIPLDVKIILFGDYETYRLLQHYDPEFSELFRVTADFEDEMTRTDESEEQYARFISSIVNDNNMLHCDRKAIARIIEYSSRQADDQNKLSLHSADIANLLRETNYVAKASNATMIRANHVEQALQNQEMRVSRLKDHVMQSFVNGTTLMTTQGDKVGQINALSVISTSDYQFGAPNRITATTAYGEGQVFDIERSVDLSGNIHSKGVMILSAYLASVFGKTAKIPLTTHLTFEQSYGGVDGDSATMAELCAIVSAFSQQPLRQDIAITGSMNQFGEAQPIGGVNEKIEGFYDVCVIQGRANGQGVIIPQSNAHNLMLRKDIVEAVEKGDFNIWAISHVTEALELLTGKPADEQDGDNGYSSHSLFGLAQAKLNALRR
ncbi:Lon protease family protein [Photobacterium sanguinicancri]|uniref:endopeptidase La n=1 Tax=Photobacterium sanguinicancri TaxID=875932 RepID=A0AAW7XZ42_9GAMM|nr:ATP-binding protein [Photobacterium sanguinicancri]KXI21142.1 ATP-dependent protease [Photobacterium sanguinicancri]MDO6498306.1 ATP-binding protein [Photobacterium sanguinicancri]MDO6541396.1 ATP-binding protein [Photobacterium sanguinicancri]OZS41923.1 ATP-dependent protease [Photobacterium sanguinicancri]